MHGLTMKFKQGNCLMLWEGYLPLR